MKITCLQMKMTLSDVDGNFALAKQLITEAAAEKPDVIVLPETWNTGYYPPEHLKELSDPDGERVKREIGGLAKELGINIVAGSAAVVKNDKVYNTAYVFNRSGEVVAEYDKTHLFSPAAEEKFFEKGDHVCAFELDGVKCGLVICYDIRFPELVRMQTIHGVDVFFMVAQWPAARTAHIRALTVARAIENQMFLACCNSCADNDGVKYAGNSAIIDPWGEVLVRAGTEQETISAECDLDIIKGIRSSINVFSDRRPELYIL